MFQLILLVSTIAGTLGASLDSSSDVRLFGGENANLEDIPWQVGLIYAEELRCGGSIISPRWILTAAHCVINLNPTVIFVHAGSEARVDGGVSIRCTESKIHSKYDWYTNEYDVAVLRMSELLTLGPKIQPIKLAERGTVIPDNSPATLSGWGTTEDTSRPGWLQVVVIFTINQTVCRNMYAQKGIKITQDMMCALDMEEGHGAYFGDSGGPLVVDHVLVGIVSFGSNPREGWPGVYARVSRARRWIDHAIQ